MAAYLETNLVDFFGFFIFISLSFLPDQKKLSGKSSIPDQNDQENKYNTICPCVKFLPYAKKLKPWERCRKGC